MTQVLESMILAFLLLGAAYTVASLGGNARDTARPRAQLDNLAHDALTVLAGLRDANGTSLDASMNEALHCARDATPDPSTCDARRGRNLSLRVQYSLPTGAGYAIMLSNGVRPSDVYRSVQPQGEAVSSSYPYTPRWNMTFLATELSCYDAGMDVNITAMPLANGRAPASATIVIRGANNATWIANKSWLADAWNISALSAARPASGALTAETVARGASYVGWTSYGSCNLNTKGPAIVAALRQAQLTAPAKILVGTTGTFTDDITSLLGVTGVTVNSATLTIYEPMTPRLNASDSWIVEQAFALPITATSSVSWDVPPSSTYATHPVVLGVNMTVSGVAVQARIVQATAIALPSGQIPVDPPYSAVLQTWFADWR